MRRPRIVHIAEDLCIGGLERVIASVASSLDRTRYHVEVWALVAGGEIADELNDSGAGVKILKLNTYHNPLKLQKLAVLLRRHRADIVHTHGYYGSTFGRLAAIIAKTPVIIAHVHTSYAGLKRRHLFIERILSFYTDKIICLSQREIEQYLQAGIGRRDQYEFVYNGLDVAAFSDTKCDRGPMREALGLSSDDRACVTVGRLVPVKGHRFLLEALAEARKVHPNLKLLCVGDGPLEPSLRAQVGQLGLSEHVRFLGFREDVPQILHACDLFVLASLNEGFGLVLLEAMACGLPVIATSVGGVPEIVAHESTGLLVPARDPQAMAEAIVRIISSPRLAARLIAEAAARLRERFSIEATVARLEQIYQAELARAGLLTGDG